MSVFDQGGLTAREEWQEILDREDVLDALFGRGPFREVEDYYPASPTRADERRDEDVAA